jgi:hypothetical protein
MYQVQKRDPMLTIPDSTENPQEEDGGGNDGDGGVAVGSTDDNPTVEETNPPEEEKGEEDNPEEAEPVENGDDKPTEQEAEPSPEDLGDGKEADLPPIDPSAGEVSFFFLIYS